MKKVITAFLLFDFVAGLLFLSFYGMRSKAVAADSGLMRIVDAEIEEDREVRKIAITFDDEVIIGLSQEICCIEAISLI